MQPECAKLTLVFARLRKDPILQDINKRYLNKTRCELSDTHALLSPSRLPGFALAEKTWGLFHIDSVKPVNWSDGLFDHLEFEKDKKKMIQTLVKIHQRSHSTFDDMIVGKGKGLVFCLHGPPGGEKTLTAGMSFYQLSLYSDAPSSHMKEVIAEHTRRPLYCVTSGDLGTDPQDADEELRDIFSIAKQWNPIVLLDEADVFLSKRKSDDIDRNAFVTIFLRCLEWFQGILFLTSNRPEEFDEAFRSRIHMSLYYPPLDEHRRAKVWESLLKGAKTPSDWNSDTFTRLGKRYELNGREIKNLISTALAVCVEDDCLLNEETIELVYQMNENGRKVDGMPQILLV